MTKKIKNFTTQYTKLCFKVAIAIGMTFSIMSIRSVSAESPTFTNVVNGSKTDAYLSVNGSLGLGTITPTDKLSLFGTGNFGVRIETAGNTSNDYAALRFQQGNMQKGGLYTNNNELYLRTIDQGGGSYGALKLNSEGGNTLLDGGGDFVLKGNASRQPNDPGDIVFWNTQTNSQKGRIWTDPRNNTLFWSGGDTVPELSLQDNTAPYPSRLTVSNSTDLLLKASPHMPNQSGNMVFQDAAGAERARIWSDADNGDLKIRNNTGDICIGSC